MHCEHICIYICSAFVNYYETTKFNGMYITPWPLCVHHFKWHFVRGLHWIILLYGISNFEGKHDHTNTYIYEMRAPSIRSPVWQFDMIFWFYISTITYPFKIASINSTNACGFIEIYFMFPLNGCAHWACEKF